MKSLIRILVLAAAISVPLLTASAQVPQCRDGIDNDGDGTFDALVNGSTTATTPTATISSGDPHLIISRVAAVQGYPNFDAFLFDAGTAQRICEILGHNVAVSYSSLHNDGRNGFTSPSNNTLFKWNPTTRVFDALNAAAAGNRWIATLVCGGVRPACANGRDDDGDGRIDLADSGCASANDTNEGIHDSGCSSTEDQTEAEQCRDGLDNDGDGVADANDPGCWNDTNNPATYNPALDNEGRATTQCQDGVDNDADGATDLSDFSCSARTDNDETNPRSACQDGVDNDSDGLTDTADPGCSTRQDNNEGDGTSQCQDGIDNDNDGSTDFPADFSCTTRQDNDELNLKAACQDGIDNDGDNLVDLSDPGCATRQDNNEGNGTSQCQDGIDNDGDGATDMADFSCSAPTDNDETNPKSACQDGIDNDNDGLTDANDPGCGNNQDNNEGDGTSQCQDGIDNDGDGSTDFPADFSCSAKTDKDETNPKSGCQDGIDNDNDGLTDMQDPGCATNQDNDESNGTSQCQDGRDNDNDGAIDFPADFSCTSKQDNDETNGKSSCQDGVDNDGDGLTDLADPGCSNNQDNNEGDGTSQCQDGRDNDADGATDFPADFSCSAPTDNDEGNPKSGCQDGVDNDGDGLTDLADPGCSTNQDNTEGDGTSACQDGKDNDGDGAIDFPADFSCASSTDSDEADPKSACQDGLDNDSDGLTDLADPGCATNQDNNEGDKTSACQDKIDNDNDGLIDLADPGCSSPTDLNEGDGTSSCQDKSDNDGDGLIDLADPGCSNPQDNNEVDETSRLQVTGECVYDNQDGTFTAYFGYENNLGVETSVVTDSSKGTVNSFSPAIPAGGQPTVFKIGRNKGVLAVVFNGDPMVWTVQIAPGVRSTATVSRASQLCQPLQPVAECIDSNNSGLLGTFGYVNPNDFALRIPVGNKNGFQAVPVDRGQPTTFNSGTNKGVFVTAFKDSLTWTLGNRSATITSSTAVCVGGCVGTSTTGIKGSLDEAALKLANFAKRAASYLDSQAKKQLSRSAAAQVSKDVVRAKRRADAYLKEANALTLNFPAVVKNCPNAAQVCQTVDNGAAIERLKGLYQQLVKAATRAVARGDFRFDKNTGKTRGNAIIVGAKAAQQVGLTALAGLPRTSTECK